MLGVYLMSFNSTLISLRSRVIKSNLKSCQILKDHETEAKGCGERSKAATIQTPKVEASSKRHRSTKSKEKMARKIRKLSSSMVRPEEKTNSDDGYVDTMLKKKTEKLLDINKIPHQEKIKNRHKFIYT